MPRCSLDRRLLQYCLVVFFNAVLIALPTRGQEVFTKLFKPDDLEGPTHIYDLVQDETGFIWLATNAGLYRFDGRKMIRYHTNTAARATAVICSDDHVFVGFDDGNVSHVFHDSLVLFHWVGPKPRSTISSLQYVKPGILWISTKGEGLFAVVTGKSIQISSAQGLSDNFVYQTAALSSGLWLATDRGVNLIKPCKSHFTVTNLTQADGLSDNIVRTLKPNERGNLLLGGTHQSGFFFLSPKELAISTPFPLPNWRYGQVNDVCWVDDHSVWIGTEDGYLVEATYRITHGVSIKAHFFPGKKLEKLLFDKSGNLWCGTDDGLLLVSARTARCLPLSRSVYSLDKLTAVVCDQYDFIWYSQNEYLWSVPLNAGEKAARMQAILPAPATCFHEDFEGRLWMGTFGKGLLMKQLNNVVTPMNHKISFIDGHILSIASIQDTLWVASLSGVVSARYDSKGDSLVLLKKYQKSQGIGSDYVYQLCHGGADSVWLATDGAGIALVTQNKLQRWDHLMGTRRNVVYTIAATSAGRVWAGAMDHGVLSFNAGHWLPLVGFAEGASKKVKVNALAALGRTAIAAIAENGLSVWQHNKPVRLFNQKSMIEIDSFPSVLHGIARTRAGQVVAPYERGFLVLDTTLALLAANPSVHLQSIKVNFTSIWNQHDFDAQENNLSFQFNGVSYTNPELLRYRYRLKGFDADWHYTLDEQANFPRLPPGKYVFIVQAAQDASFRNAASAEYAFSIQPPFWTRTWFVAAVALLLVAALYRFIHFREKHATKLARLHEERIAFEYENLKNQVSPHFLFNSLNTLANLIEEDTRAAVRFTDDLADFYRNILSFRHRDLVTLSEELSFVKRYTLIQQKRFGSALTLDIDVANEIAEGKSIVPLALQMLIENAIKHNIVSVDCPLCIQIVATDSYLEVSNPIRPKRSREPGTGVGLANIEKRYKLLTHIPVLVNKEGGQFRVRLPML